MILKGFDGVLQNIVNRSHIIKNHQRHIDAYNEKYDNKAVRTNVTIPTWLKTVAEANILTSQRFYRTP